MVQEFLGGFSTPDDRLTGTMDTSAGGRTMADVTSVSFFTRAWCGPTRGMRRSYPRFTPLFHALRRGIFNALRRVSMEHFLRFCRSDVLCLYRYLRAHSFAPFAPRHFCFARPRMTILGSTSIPRQPTQVSFTSLHSKPSAPLL